MLQEHSAILSICIELPFVIKIFVLSIFEWPFYTGFTVYSNAYILLHVYKSGTGAELTSGTQSRSKKRAGQFGLWLLSI